MPVSTDGVVVGVSARLLGSIAVIGVLAEEPTTAVPAAGAEVEVVVVWSAADLVGVAAGVVVFEPLPQPADAATRQTTDNPIPAVRRVQCIVFDLASHVRLCDH
jgi:hypothetical protein